MVSVDVKPHERRRFKRHEVVDRVTHRGRAAQRLVPLGIWVTTLKWNHRMRRQLLPEEDQNTHHNRTLPLTGCYKTRTYVQGGPPLN